MLSTVWCKHCFFGSSRIPPERWEGVRDKRLHSWLVGPQTFLQRVTFIQAREMKRGA